MRVLRSKSLVLDVYGAFVRDLGSWIAIADLVDLMGDLGVDEQAVRSSVSRFTQKGLLVSEVRDSDAGYRLSDHGLTILREGDARIYQKLEPSSLEDGWVLASFSIPESMRAQRHQLRKRLTWLGFGNLKGGLWMAPRHVLSRTRKMVQDLELAEFVELFIADHVAFGPVEELVARAWDLQAIRDANQRFIDEFAPVLDEWARKAPLQDPRGAFRDYVAAVHQWRKMPFVDPGLPPELFSEDWEGTRASELFGKLHNLLAEAAHLHVRHGTGN